jgi:hypothetical protein
MGRRFRFMPLETVVARPSIDHQGVGRPSPMTRKLVPLLTALALALPGAAFTACSNDDRPEGEDVERSAEEAADKAKETANDAAKAAEEATDEQP